MDQNDSSSVAGAEGMSPLMEGAHQLHEMYSTWVAAGFSDAQAIYLVGAVLAAQINREGDTPGSAGSVGPAPEA